MGEVGHDSAALSHVARALYEVAVDGDVAVGVPHASRARAGPAGGAFSRRRGTTPCPALDKWALADGMIDVQLAEGTDNSGHHTETQPHPDHRH